jgi:hypothetical protein
MKNKYRLKKRFYFKDGGSVAAGTILEWTDQHGGCYWWDLDHFGKEFVENNTEFFEMVPWVTKKVCEHVSGKHSFVYWACDDCFANYDFDQYTHEIVGRRIKSFYDEILRLSSVKTKVSKIVHSENKYYALCEQCGNDEYPHARKDLWYGITVHAGRCDKCNKEATLIPVADWEGHGD